MTTIEPVRTREPFFDGWETGKVRYTYSCRSCRTETTIGFKDILQAAWGWREKTEPHLRSSVATHFGIDLTKKYIGDGMDAVVVSQCSNCSHTTFVYFWFHEYRNSCYQISCVDFHPMTPSQSVGPHDAHYHFLKTDNQGQQFFYLGTPFSRPYIVEDAACT